MTDHYFSQITSARDPRWPAFLRLLELEIPARQLMPPSFWAEVICKQEMGGVEEFHLVVIQAQGAVRNEETDPVIGGMLYEYTSGSDYAELWYLAIEQRKQGRGLGTEFLHELEQRLQVYPKCRAILFEIERFDQVADEQRRKQALDRERFYQLWGAKIARKLWYLQSVGEWQPVTPMFLCVYPIDPSLSEAEMGKMLYDCFPPESNSGIQNRPTEQPIF